MHATRIDHPKYYELIDGRRYAKVSPQRTHALLQGWLFRRIADTCGDRGEVGTEWKCYLGGRPGLKNALQPDVSFVSYERLRALTPAQREKPRFAPDVAVEIRSPDDKPGLLRRKIAKYLAHGATIVIEVNPAKQTVAVYEGAAPRVFHDGERLKLDSVPWLQFGVSELFAAAEYRG